MSLVLCSEVQDCFGQQKTNSLASRTHRKNANSRKSIPLYKNHDSQVNFSFSFFQDISSLVFTHSACDNHQTSMWHSFNAYRSQLVLSLVFLSLLDMATPGASADDRKEGRTVLEPDFPVGHAIYHFEPASFRDVPVSVADPHRFRSPSPADPRVRDWTSFYDLKNLVLPKQYPPPEKPLGELRQGWKNMFETEENGDWESVEYVPAWTDPNWSHRFIFLPGVDIPKGKTDDPLLQQYAKTGTLQKLHPALTIDDVLFRPTTEAKRWGFYPFHSQFGLTDNSYSSDLPTGHSGATPIKPWFPQIPLKIPGPTPANRNIQYSVSEADLAAERENYKRICQGSGQAITENGFGIHLRGRLEASEPDSQPKALAEALLTLWEWQQRKIELEAYQRMIFMDNTAQDVRQALQDLLRSPTPSKAIA